MKKIFLVFSLVLVSTMLSAQCSAYRSHYSAAPKPLISVLYNLNQSAQNVVVEAGLGSGRSMFGVSLAYTQKPHSKEYKPMLFMQTMLFNNNNSIYGGVMVGGRFLNTIDSYTYFDIAIGGKLSAYLTPRIAITYNLDYILNTSTLSNSVGLTILFN